MEQVPSSLVDMLLEWHGELSTAGAGQMQQQHAGGQDQAQGRMLQHQAPGDRQRQPSHSPPSPDLGRGQAEALEDHVYAPDPTSRLQQLQAMRQSYSMSYKKPDGQAANGSSTQMPGPEAFPPALLQALVGSLAHGVSDPGQQHQQQQQQQQQQQHHAWAPPGEAPGGAGGRDAAAVSHGQTADTYSGGAEGGEERPDALGGADEAHEGDDGEDDRAASPHTEIDPERRQRQKSNSEAQRRYRARQKERKEGLQSTLAQLSNKVVELGTVKRTRACLHARAARLDLSIAIADADIASMRIPTAAPAPKVGRKMLPQTLSRELATAAAVAATPDNTTSAEPTPAAAATPAAHRAARAESEGQQEGVSEPHPQPLVPGRRFAEGDPRNWCDAHGVGALGSVQEDAQPIGNGLAADMHRDLEEVRVFLAQVPSVDVTLLDLSPAQAAKATRLAWSLVTTCMQLHAAATRYDVLTDITSTLAQHMQRAQHAQHAAGTSTHTHAAEQPQLAPIAAEAPVATPISISTGGSKRGLPLAPDEKESDDESNDKTDTDEEGPAEIPQAASLGVAGGPELATGVMQAGDSCKPRQGGTLPALHAHDELESDRTQRSVTAVANTEHPTRVKTPTKESQSYVVKIPESLKAVMEGPDPPPAGVSPPQGSDIMAEAMRFSATGAPDSCHRDHSPQAMHARTAPQMPPTLLSVGPVDAAQHLGTVATGAAGGSSEASSLRQLAQGIAGLLHCGHDPAKLQVLAHRLRLTKLAKQAAQVLYRSHVMRMHLIEVNRSRIKLDVVKALLPPPLGGNDSAWPAATANLRATHTGCPQTQLVLRALEESLMHERRAQQELVYLMSARVLDAVQWCAVAVALYPLHCDLEPLLKAIACLPE